MNYGIMILLRVVPSKNPLFFFINMTCENIVALMKREVCQKKLSQKQYMLVRIVEEKRDFVRKLRNLYSELNSQSETNQPIPDDVREDLDRLRIEIAQADVILDR